MEATPRRAHAPAMRPSCLSRPPPPPPLRVVARLSPAAAAALGLPTRPLPTIRCDVDRGKGEVSFSRSSVFAALGAALGALLETSASDPDSSARHPDATRMPPLDVELDDGAILGGSAASLTQPLPGADAAAAGGRPLLVTLVPAARGMGGAIAPGQVRGRGDGPIGGAGVVPARSMSQDLQGSGSLADLPRRLSVSLSSTAYRVSEATGLGPAVAAASAFLRGIAGLDADDSSSGDEFERPVARFLPAPEPRDRGPPPEYFGGDSTVQLPNRGDTE